MRDFPLANSNFLAVALYMATTAMVEWIKVLEVCVSNRTTLIYILQKKLDKVVELVGGGSVIIGAYPV